ncbi:Lon protease family protein [Halarsenatibacter silvermanii]|uniref:endopeptidase La n=1 Tax=Halarsenatibacter silvermanii TaxID=321763 RepID=A0A1G9I6T7_9FIRM|nr:ATP-binding protein [Halarsenatibacter silvermanii]SDL20786.1 lon-related putative ATP-dependent protease [Halarsenatibacter silvermanii]
MRELDAEELRCECARDQFEFETTEEITPFEEGIIGQQRAVEATDFGFNIDKEGYNIFMAGPIGTGKKTYARRKSQDIADEIPTPNDMLYIFNFEDPESPRAITIPAGSGRPLSDDMDNVIEELKEELPKLFEGEEFEEKRSEIMGEYQQESNRMMEEFDQEIREEGFTLQKSERGPVPVPINEEGEPIKQDEYQKLDDDRREEIREKSQQIKKQLDKLMRNIRDKKEEAQEKLSELQEEMGLSIVQPIIDQLKHRYSDCGEEVTDYLEDVKQDIVNNLDKFLQGDNDQQMPFPVNMGEGDDDFFVRYQVNLIVDNSDTEGGPVVFETNPTYYNLFGKIEGKSKFGTVTTDFTMIKGGSLHEANGGYLILQAKDVLTNHFSWETLKRALINQEHKVENIGEQYRSYPISSLKPEPFDINVKVIMVGSPMLYSLLYNFDEEFKKLFKIKAHFDTEMERSQENMRDFASFVAQVCEREDINHFCAGAVSKTIEYSSRLARDGKKMTTRFNELIEVIYEASTWSEMEDDDKVREEHVQKALEKKEYRANLAEEKIQEMLDRDRLLIDVKGEQIGQINGLSVHHSGEHTFGRPSRITCQSFPGKEGVVNIERKAEMSGSIHDKGVLILSGFLGGRYAREHSLTLSASLAFEQSYSDIDGDSASCAELLAIISSVTELPLRQDLAITGSMNQRGVVQPIGGANCKIEGFYDVCRNRGFTGEQGVVIPEQNLENLMLEDRVLESVGRGEFHIYTVERIDEAIDLFFEPSVEEVDSRMESVLEEMAETARNLQDEDEKGEDESV